MSKQTKQEQSLKAQPARGFCKLMAVTALAIAVVTILAYFLDNAVLDTLKHSLSIGTIILLVVIINLVSFICFLILMAAYQWIRPDFKCKKPDDDLDRL